MTAWPPEQAEMRPFSSSLLLGLAADIMWRTDATQTIRDVEMLGEWVSRNVLEELRGRSLSALMGHADRQDRERGLAALAAHNAFRDVRLSVGTTGGRGYLLFSGLPSRFSTGNGVCYEGVGRLVSAPGSDDRHRREVAYLLEQAELGREREERARREAEMLLRSIVHLTRPLPFGEKCRHLFKAFRGGLEFDSAVLLRYGVKGRFYVTASSDESLIGTSVGSHPLLQEALQEEALSVPDLADIDHDSDGLPSFVWSRRAALFSTIRIGKERALLVLLHHQPGFYSDFDLRLMRRLSVVAMEALQLDIQRAMAVNASKLAALGEVIAGIAHEINQPLSIIGLSTANIRNALQGNRQAEAVERKLARIEQQVGQVGAIVRSIRSFAYPQKGSEPVEPLSLFELMETVQILSTGGLREKGVVLEVDIPPGCPMVMANRIGFQQVLVNLINNARDAIVDRSAREGSGLTGRIRIRAMMEGDGYVRLTVQDNGGGIPAEALNQVFDSFYTLKEEGQGTGLGLPICKMLVESFGGNISLDNAGEGAEATLQLIAAPGGA